MSSNNSGPYEARPSSSTEPPRPSHRKSHAPNATSSPTSASHRGTNNVLSQDKPSPPPNPYDLRDALAKIGSAGVHQFGPTRITQGAQYVAILQEPAKYVSAAPGSSTRPRGAEDLGGLVDAYGERSEEPAVDRARGRRQRPSGEERDGDRAARDCSSHVPVAPPSSAGTRRRRDAVASRRTRSDSR